MTNDDLQRLENATDGLAAYEYIANHIDQLDGPAIQKVTDLLMRADLNGQFCVSAARYLTAIDPVAYAEPIDRLVKGAIERDRERRYIGDLLESLWGKDYKEHASELTANDDNFRRIYKRVFPDRL
ncbi:MAG: hypothetical protein HDS86_02740 [Bacteroidales bacterium]|nr:hypothetical protein [Bacteroidales bacterium]